MLDVKTLNEFTKEVNRAYQQFCVWLSANNEFAKYQEKWNKIANPKNFLIEEFSRERGCKYKNFWDVVIPSLQHSWISSLAKLFDPAYFVRDTKKYNPRLCLDYVLGLLGDDNLRQSIKEQMGNHKNFVESIKEQRNNFLSHNDIKFSNERIEAGANSLFETLDSIIEEIKNKDASLKNCNTVNLEYTKKLSKCGVAEIFEELSKS